MKTLLEGKSFLFGSNISTDDILPGRYLDRANEEVGPFAMSGIDPHFAEKVKPGDFIVARDNFGMGSGRESAPMALKLCGLGAVIAQSYSRLFYRSAINLGLPAILVASTEGIGAGDHLVLDLSARTLLHVDSGRILSIQNVTGTSLAILEAGGIVPFTKARRAQRPLPKP
jgi:3-isopropylmalate/(R)-2-methylmalate dehydratase small subunit